MRILIVRPDAPFPAQGNDGVGRAIEALCYGFSVSKEDVDIDVYNTHHDTSMGYIINKNTINFVKRVDWNHVYDKYDVVNFHTGPELPIPFNKRFVRTLHWVVVGEGTVRLMQEGQHTVLGASKACTDKYNLPSIYVHSALYLNQISCDMIKTGYRNKKDYYIWIGGTDWFQQKGLDVAIQIAQITGINLLICGDGKDENVIKFIKSKCNSKIKYLGPTKNDSEKYALMAQSQGLLYPTLIADGCPMTVVEALSCGCPVFAYDHSSLPELVDDSNGILVETGNKMSMMKAVAMNRRKQWDYHSISQNAQDKFSPERAAQKYLDIFKKLL